MIKNVVFDFGQVMVRFEPSYMVGRYVDDKDDAALLEEVVFDRLYWDKLDSADISDDEVVSACRERLPERLWQVAERIYFDWIFNLPEIDGMRELVRYIKRQYGVRVLLLSNISTYFAEHADEIDVLREFEACVFSAVIGKVKPSADIFEYVCQKYGMLAEETVFVDDNPNNIKGAQSVGITGYLFDGDADKLKAYLDGVLGN
ncbi:MAG: HAD family phosphatase [Clostridia bacterium]|nr:HAD family phosphatase [Clostridia bacterium]